MTPSPYCAGLSVDRPHPDGQAAQIGRAFVERQLLVAFGMAD